MKKIVKILIIFLSLTFYLVVTQNLFGAEIPPPPFPGQPLAQQENPLGGIKPPPGVGVAPTVEGLGGFIGAIIRLLVIGAGVIALIVLLIGGIQYSTAGGDPKSTEAARAKIIAGVIGLLITLSSFVIIRLVEFFFRIPILKFTPPTF